MVSDDAADEWNRYLTIRLRLRPCKSVCDLGVDGGGLIIKQKAPMIMNHGSVIIIIITFIFISATVCVGSIANLSTHRWSWLLFALML